MFDKKPGPRFSPGTRELNPKVKKNKQTSFPRRFFIRTAGDSSKSPTDASFSKISPGISYRSENRHCNWSIFATNIHDDDALSLSLSRRRRFFVQEIGRTLNFPFVSQHLELWESQQCDLVLSIHLDVFSP